MGTNLANWVELFEFIGILKGHRAADLAAMSAGLTHPVDAPLDRPHFRFAGKRVAAI